MTIIADINDTTQRQKKGKKSFWFEFAEEKGVNPHKSVWSEFERQNEEKPRQIQKQRYCTKCGATLPVDGKFCERCGQKVRNFK